MIHTISFEGQTLLIFHKQFSASKRIFDFISGPIIIIWVSDASALENLNCFLTEALFKHHQIILFIAIGVIFLKLSFPSLETLTISS